MPQIDSSLKQHSLALQNIIKERIEHENNISFAQFMQMALYQPGYGYYSSGTHKFGKEGDFVTSPELGSLFAQCMAQQFQQVLSQIESPVILELGAGTGQFCYDCLLALDDMHCLPKTYTILEVSADLQQRQKDKIKTLPKHLSSLVEWIQQPLEQPFNGVIFANEVIDALAVEVFRVENLHYQQMCVTWNDDIDHGFKEKWQAMPDNLAQQLEAKELTLSDGYVSEFVPNLSAWLKTITENLKQGVVLLVDYGYERSAYYHPQRNQGTLICFSQHQANFNYFENVGIQDMTAFVDFTAVAEAADDCRLDVDGYTTQAHFLMSLGIEQKLGDSENDYTNYYKNTTEMKKLVMPNEMGEKFKVIAFSKNFEQALMGFNFSNQLHLL
jgi:SAM-dependent MidA family methyltransferase